METAIAVINVVLGLVALVGGGEFLVRSSAKLAAAVGIPPVVIGLTVVAFATSAPELAVVVQSAFAAKTDLAIGNAVGSNIFNVLFVLGLSALVTPLLVSSRLVRLDVPLMIGASILLLLLSIDGVLSRLDGLLLFGLLIAYLTWTIRESRQVKPGVADEFAKEFQPPTKGSLWIQAAFFVAGLILLIVGANFIVAGGVSIAQSFGVSELVIGLTVIAIGTSLPEVVTSVVASYRGERDIAVGNIVGSNLYNILAVLGLGSIAAPLGIAVSPNAIQFDIPVMIAVAVACLPIFYIGHKIARWEGAVLLGYYIAYTAYLILEGSKSNMAQLLETGLVYFAIPLTTLTFLIGVYRFWRHGVSEEGVDTTE